MKLDELYKHKDDLLAYKLISYSRLFDEIVIPNTDFRYGRIKLKDSDNIYYSIRTRYNNKILEISGSRETLFTSCGATYAWDKVREAEESFKTYVLPKIMLDIDQCIAKLNDKS